MSDDGRKLFRYTDDEILAMAAGSDNDPLLTAALLEILALRKEVGDLTVAYDRLYAAFHEYRPKVAIKYRRVQQNDSDLSVHEGTYKS